MITIEDILTQELGFSIDSSGDYRNGRLLVKRSNIDGNYHIFLNSSIFSPDEHICSASMESFLPGLIKVVQEKITKESC